MRFLAAALVVLFSLPAQAQLTTLRCRTPGGSQGDCAAPILGTYVSWGTPGSIGSMTPGLITGTTITASGHFAGNGSGLSGIPTSALMGTLTVDQGNGEPTTPWYQVLSDGSMAYVAAKSGQFPAALVGGRLDVNVGAAVLPNGASTAALQGTGNATLASILTALQATLAADVTDRAGRLLGIISGSVSIGASSLPANAAQETGGNLAAINAKLPALVGGRIPVDGSGLTQPVSAVALPLPPGAATSTIQTVGNASLASIDGKTPALGQAAMAGSVPVAIASNQSGIPITAVSLPLPTGAATTAKQPAFGFAGTPSADVLTVQGASGGQPMPVSGPLTDVQLRAAPVVVSGTITATGGLTDTQLRASPVPVNGTVSTGGLTDTQLRASPVVVSGAVTTGAVTQGTAGTTAGAWPVRNTDGTNVQAVKAASAAAVAADPSAVVAFSPNTPLPAGANALGSVAVSAMTGVISAANSSTTPLVGSGTFTGTFSDTLNYPNINIGIFSDQASAALGFTVQWSSDCVNVDDADSFNVPASNGQQISFGAKFRCVRVVYVNGLTPQGAFRLQTILRPGDARDSTHRLGNAESDEQDATLNKAALIGRDSTGTWRAVNIDGAGNLTTSTSHATTPTVTRITPTVATSTSALATSSTRLGASIFAEDQFVYLKFGAAASITSYSVQIPPLGLYEIPSTMAGLAAAVYCSTACNLQVTEVN